MKRSFITAATALALAAPGVAAAPLTGGDFEVPSTTLDAGGGRSSGGAFTLHGTIGQHDASPATLTGGNYALTGGFWIRGANGDLIFADSFE